MNNLKCLVNGEVLGKGLPKTKEEIFKYVFRGLDVETFYAEYWEKKPLYIKSDKPNYYKDILEESDIDEFLCGRFLHEGDIRVFKCESQAPFNTYSKPLPGLYSHRKVVQASKALGLYQDGYTLIFQNVNKYSKSFGSLVRSFEREAQFSARSNIYVTPPKNHGFGKHWDHMCSIILQLDGEKEWRVYEQEVTYPNHILGPDQGKGKSSELIFTKVLKPGDLLYIPRGFPHAPQTNNCHSVHVNIAFKPIYVSELLNTFVHHATATEPLLSRGIHPLSSDIDEETTAIVTSLLENYDWKSALQLARQDILQDRPPMYQQWWRQEKLLSHVSNKTTFHFNPKMEWCFRELENHILIVTNGNKIAVEKENKELLLFIQACDHKFSYEDLSFFNDNICNKLLSELIKLGVIFIKQEQEKI
ncbi:cupin domain-containing protein [Microbulbifer sp. ZKSA004]|uniref:cupin domain-containing protein n=1 Tax=Microbulbifer sp. ZKSA004 TaxID=3243389 RepID=UPI00403A61F7